jgi:hypothetical protein
MVTRTINRIHFNDLDPIRFEELVLSMVYRSQRWIKINHFGEKGSDSGIDIEAVEELENGKFRKFIYQCKRYDSINWSKLSAIGIDFFKKNGKIPDVYILVISCPVSKMNIEKFEEFMNKKGISSVSVWTRSLLETKLYSEFHDLLFVYFGIDLSQDRKNKIEMVKRNIYLKERMRRDFIKQSVKMDTQLFFERQKNPSLRFNYSEVILRSIDDTRYPEFESAVYCKCELFDFYYGGIKLFISPGWRNLKIQQDDSVLETKAITVGFLPFTNIIDYDLIGDEYYSMPHIFCDYVNKNNPYEKIGYAS